MKGAFVGGLLWAPLVPAMLAVAYRDRTGSVEPEPDATGAAEPV